MKYKNVLQLKINLMGARPSIYRTIYLSNKCNFLELHTAIQDAMGWTGYHLSAFRKGRDTEISFQYSKKGPGDYVNFGYPLTTKISEFLQKPKDRIVYEYDFGDSWEHEIIVQKVIEEIELEHLPYCIKGKGNCPPEDCGGIWEYSNLLEIAKNPGSAEYKEYETDYGYNMEVFINTEFTKDEMDQVNDSFFDFESAVDYQKSIFKEMKSAF
jgi:hypothetical protein